MAKRGKERMPSSSAFSKFRDVTHAGRRDFAFRLRRQSRVTRESEAGLVDLPVFMTPLPQLLLLCVLALPMVEATRW